VSRKRKSDSRMVLEHAVYLDTAKTPAERLRLCALISYRLSRITARDTRLGKTTQLKKR